jgi:hypothetical protein
VAPEPDADQGQGRDRDRDNHHDLPERASVLGRFSGGSFCAVGRINRTFGLVEHLLHLGQSFFGLRDLLAS